MKKIFATITVLFLSLGVQANDTSGCSTRENLKETRTSNGNNLQVQYEMAPGSSCWNADEGAITIAYEWLQKNKLGDLAKIPD